MNLREVARYDKGIVRGEAQVTEEGFIKARAIVTRTGVFLYKNADGTVRKELRHPDDVLQLDSLESMKMIPVVNGHPTERLVTAENAKRLAIGYTGETVEKEDPFIVSNLVITDSQAVKDVLDKRKNELSLGYTVDLEPEVGLYNGEPYDFRQRNIKYNHLALVDTARAGPEARIALDGEDAEEIQQEEAKMAKTRKLKIDGEEYMVDNEVGKKVESIMEEREKLKARLAEIEAQLDVSNAEKDSMAEKLEDRKSKDSINAQGKEVDPPGTMNGQESHVRDPQPRTNMQTHVPNHNVQTSTGENLPHVSKVDAADVNSLVRERVRLHRMAEKILDKKILARLDDMSELEIKKSIIKSIQKNADLEGKSEIYINARFDSVLEDLPKERVHAKPAKYTDVQHDQADAKGSRHAMINRFHNAYKGGK